MPKYGVEDVLGWLWNEALAAIALAALIAAYPLVYYLVGYVPRYLFPTGVLLLVLAASDAVAWIERAREGT